MSCPPHRAITKAAVIAIPHPRRRERPFHIVLPRAHAAAVELREFLAELMAKRRLPASIARVDELPHGPTGKLANNVTRQRLTP